MRQTALPGVFQTLQQLVHGRGKPLQGGMNLRSEQRLCGLIHRLGLYLYQLQSSLVGAGLDVLDGVDLDFLSEADHLSCEGGLLGAKLLMGVDHCHARFEHGRL